MRQDRWYRQEVLAFQWYGPCRRLGSNYLWVDVERASCCKQKLHDCCFPVFQQNSHFYQQLQGVCVVNKTWGVLKPNCSLFGEKISAVILAGTLTSGSSELLGEDLSWHYSRKILSSLQDIHLDLDLVLSWSLEWELRYILKDLWLWRVLPLVRNTEVNLSVKLCFHLMRTFLFWYAYVESWFNLNASLLMYPDTYNLSFQKIHASGWSSDLQKKPCFFWK